MKPFTYVRVPDEDRAILAGTALRTRFVAGGTSLVDLMKIGVERPDTVVDLASLSLSAIEAMPNGAVRIGAMARNADVAYHPIVASRFPVLAQALLAGASPQIRNVATVGGNLLQRTRCPYFRDVASSCNKRDPGSGCGAWDGDNRTNAVLGGSPHCIAVNPSDMSVALMALDAVVVVRGADASREIPIGDLHVLPGDHPEVETTLRRGELVTHVVLPPRPFAGRSRYVKVADRAAFAFALASAAVALDVRRGAIQSARVALGGVATKPWRSVEAENELVGAAPSKHVFEAAARAAMASAIPRPHNAFKIDLAQRTLVRALEDVGGAS